MAGAGTVRELETKVRDCINRPRLHHALYSSDPKEFFVVCSALDVIGDTTMAIDAYRELAEAGSYGERYLRLYGLLQAFFIQQDAAEHILQSLKLTCEAPRDDLLYVREIRNQAIGHPTKRARRRKENIPQRSHAIARNTMWSKGFLLLTSTEEGQSYSTRVSITELIEKQERGIAEILRAALEQLEAAEEKHRMKYRDQKLASIFHDQIEYHIEKCYEGCRNDDGNGRRTFAEMNVDLLSETLLKFREALTERGILPAYDHIEMDLAEVEYPLREFKKFICGDADSTLNERSAKIFVFFMRHHFRELKQCAEELDRDYMEQLAPAGRPATNAGYPSTC